MTPKYMYAAVTTGALGALTACPAAKSDPSWIDDVRPIVKANCLRCHSSPAIAGAPTDFRLDVFEDTTLANGRIIRGAATMAPYIAARAGEQGTMPPDFERSPRERDTFVNWYETGRLENTPRIGVRPDNTPPTARLISELPSSNTVDKDTVTFEYQIDDDDGDLVSGVFRLGSQVIADDVQSGRGVVSFSTVSFPNGTYNLIADITDDSIRVDPILGTIEIAHSDGNAAPTILLDPPVRDRLFADAQSPLSLRVIATDPNDDSVQITVTAFRGAEEVQVATDVPTAADGTIDIPWDTTAVAPGPGWRLRIRASDAKGATNQLESGRFVISHSTTNLVFDDVRPLFEASCRGCHPRFGIRNMTHVLDTHGDSGPALGVNSLRGLIYRRVVQERNMPPASAGTLIDDWRPLTTEEVATLEEYLLGGSPP